MREKEGERIMTDLEYINQEMIRKLGYIEEKRINPYEHIMLKLVLNIAQSLEAIANKNKEANDEPDKNR